ncbi:MAG: hypothetical protein IJ466_07180 [Clostridia bacterium]|nr:hypothetical protein [Clostridia bacterium]
MSDKMVTFECGHPLPSYPPALHAEQTALIAEMIREMLAPVVSSIAKALDNNTQAMEQLAAAQLIQNDRLEALEKQVRLNTPISPQQVRYLNNAIREKARRLLYERKIEDGKATTKLAGCIRKGLLAQYGMAAIQEIPRHEYKVALGWIETWMNALSVLDVVKEARKRREEEDLAKAEQPANPDGAAAHAGMDDQHGKPDLPGNCGGMG